MYEYALEMKKIYTPRPKIMPVNILTVERQFSGGLRDLIVAILFKY